VLYVCCLFLQLLQGQLSQSNARVHELSAPKMRISDDTVDVDSRQRAAAYNSKHVQAEALAASLAKQVRAPIGWVGNCSVMCCVSAGIPSMSLVMTAGLVHCDHCCNPLPPSCSAAINESLP
jgi:hypothetical protein